MEVVQGFRLSPQQRRVWLLQRDSRAYWSQCAISIDGPLDILVLKDTIHRLIERHEILRTTFECLPGMKIPVQVVRDEVAHSLCEVDFSDQPVAERSSLVDQLFGEMHLQAFDTPPGMAGRYTLVRLSPVEHVLLISLPALCGDRQTLNNLLGEVSRLYLAIMQESDEPEETVQYAQFSAWQYELLDEKDGDAGREFWRRQASFNAVSLKLPLESSPAEISAFAPRTHTLVLEDNIVNNVVTNLGEHGVPNCVFLFACWQSLLRRLTKQADIVVRYLCNGRVYEEMSDAFGLYDRWPLLHTQFEEGERFTKILEQIDRTVTDACDWQEYYSCDPLASAAGGNEAGESLLHIGFDFTEQPAARVACDLKFSITRQYSCTERMKLRLSCARTEHALIAEFHYDPSFYDESVIENLAGQFATLVRSVASRPESLISELEIIGERERQKLLVEWNATEAEFERDATIQQLFEAQAALTPDALAVLCDDRKLSFHELNERANQLARHLQSLGVCAETRVALCVERSLEMIVGLLGILKAGGAYVPLDAAQPQSRLSFMLEDAQVGVVLTHESLTGLLPARNARVVCLDTDSQAIAQHDSSNLPGQATARNLAYMIYTSGSTGRPKSTMIEHRSVINLLGALKRTIYADVGRALRVSVNAPLAFDSSVKQVIQLLSGHALCVVPEEVRRDGERMLRYLSEHEVDVLDCTPSQLRLLLSAGLGTHTDLAVRRVLVGGEAIDAALWLELAAQDSIAYFNVYGPTECTVDTTVRRITQEQIEPTLGRAISNVQVYILDERQQLVPLGMTGELCIGGEGVGRGYHNHAALTAERFVPHPFSLKPGARLYRTGDAARYTATGELEYAGRLDGQVKIRGSRIELGEVEVALSAHPCVRTCVVVAREDAQGGARLVAYVVLHESASSSVRELRAFLSEKLPEYMIPSVVMLLEEMPLTPNGKINRYALPAPGQVRPDPDEAFDAPRTPAEGILAGLWEHLLGVGRVGINDDFFELGGHSLLAMQLISRVREAFQIEIPLPALFEAPTVATLAARIEEIIKAGDGLLAPPIRPVSRAGGHLPLSFAQMRLWFLHQLEPTSALYNIPLAIRLRGPLNVSAMEQSLTEIVRRHEVLRTTYATSDGQPVQIIHSPQTLGLPVVDLSALPAAEREAQAQRLATAEALRPFNLSEGPLMRATFLRLDEDEHLALFTMHHITSDGWSMAMLTREVAVLYDAFSAGAASPLAELPVQYADFAHWQRNWLRGEVLDAHLDFWKQQLDGAQPVLQLPTDRPRPPAPTYRGANLSLALPVDVTATLKALSREEGVTLFMTMLAAFKTLLHRYTNQSDIIVGTGIANRTRAEIEGLIGFFVNTLVLRTDLSGNPTFRELLARVREITLGAYAHQDLPFEVLVEALQPERNLSYTPLFQVMVVLQNTPRKASGVSGLSLNSREVDSGTAKFDLHLAINEGTDRIGLGLEYSTELFDETTIRRMLSHFQNLLQAICAHPDTHLDDLSLLSDAERHHQLFACNQTDYSDPDLDLRLHQLFEHQVERTPDSIALLFEQEQLSYRQLNERANQLAHHLHTLGVRPESLVGVLMERSTEMVVSLLAIVKAGAAYVPLDPAYPQQRLSFMLADAGVEVLLTQSHLSERLAAASLDARSFTTLHLDQQWAEVAHHRTSNPDVAVEAENAAYMIYTSGSTGRPKGVVNTHRGIVNRLVWMQQEYQLTGADRILQKTPFSFDVSVWEFFWPLMTGARLVVARPGGHQEASYLVRTIREHGITTLHFVPSMLEVFLEEREVGQCQSVRRVMSSGEALSVELEERFFEKLGSAELHNLYGPTEAAVDVSYWRCAAGTGRRSVPIGRPIANTQLYVLDSQMEAVAVGVSGEVYIGGVGLARGYKGRAELTAERFVPDPHSAEKGGRLYRTGDVGRRLEGGEIEYLGRQDEQVKIRGFRIELGEVGSVIREQAGVRECVVIAKEEGGGEKRLVAYVVGEQGAGELSTSELRAELKKRLPEYMMPSAIVMMEEMPVTANGKLDRRALPAPEEVWSEGGASFVAARTPVEEVLAGIWCGVLRKTEIGVNDNFFELGGHSLLATQVVSRIREALGVEIPVRAVFEKPTVAMLAADAEQMMYEGGSLHAPPVARTSREIELPLSFAQQRLWFIDRLTPGSPIYNMPVAVRLDGALDLDALARTLREIVRRHEVLRTSFVTVEGQPAQVIRPEARADEMSLPLVDLSSLPEALREAEAQRLARAEAIRPFDLAEGSLLRTTVLRLDAERHIALLTLHHIVCDGWSMGVLVREVGSLYNAFSQGLASPLAELPVQYADYAVWQRAWLDGEVLAQHTDYWKKQLADAPGLLELPTDRPRPAVQTHRGASVGMVLSKELTAKLREMCRAEGATLFMLLLAVLKVLLARYTGQEDISVGTPIAGRNRVETEGLIGFFVNTLVLRTDLSGDPSARELMRRVREVALGAYAHQELPFEKLVEELQVERSLSHTPFFQVVFLLQNAGQEVLELPGLSLSAAGEASGAAKYDLTLSMSESGEAISGALEYNTDLFDETTIRRLVGHFETLLESFVSEPAQRLSQLQMLTGAERQRMLYEWSEAPDEAVAPEASEAGEAKASSQQQCLQDVFEAQVERTPDSIALVFDEQQISYRELNSRANQLAHYLQSLGVREESLVGILVERSVEMLVGILAALKAGAAYVPLDPSYPQERLAFMLADAGVKVLLTQHHLAEKFASSSLDARSFETLYLDRDWARVAEHSTDNPTRRSVAANAAYVIYTSGSTGKPKGVVVPHAGALNLADAQRRALDVRHATRVLQCASLSFDASVWELLVSLLCGATLCLPKPETQMAGPALRELLQQQAIELVLLTPTVLATVESDRLPCLRTVVTGGEACPAELAARWSAHGRRLINAYGPTEITVIATMSAPLTGERLPPIGRPIKKMQAYVLDRYMQPVAVGVTGELYVGGAGVTRGYLHRAELTAEKFVPHPFSLKKGARLYRTGDFARYLADGQLEYVGRIDEQVKVRGLRIELNEIEAVLLQHESVREAVVVARADESGERRLVAYLVTRDDRKGTPQNADAASQTSPPTASELRLHAKQYLPEYMIPSAFVLLESLPLTPIGKVDKKMLPALTTARPSLASAYIKPQTVTEQSLAAIWQDLLHLSEVGTEDNFFDLGGNSLLLVQLHARLQKIFGEQLTMVDLFEHPTIGSLAARLSREESAQSAGQAARFEKRMTGKERQHQRLQQRKRLVKTGEDSDD